MMLETSPIIQEMSTKPILLTKGKGAIQPSARLLHATFQHDPVINYLLHTLAPERKASYLRPYFESCMTAASLNQALFHHVDAEDGSEWESLGVLMPPGKKVDNPWTLVPAGILQVMYNGGWGVLRQTLAYGPTTEKSKERHLKPLLSSPGNYYYVFFLATLESARGQGLCSRIVKQWQGLAAAEGIPIWLEATTEYSMRLYEKLEFKVVDEIVFGKGKVDRSGVAVRGGEGITIWGMIWAAEMKSLE